MTQMKWRLQEGQGEAIYEIGVKDNGVLAGLTDHEMKASMDTLHTMASRLILYLSTGFPQNSSIYFQQKIKISNRICNINRSKVR